MMKAHRTLLPILLATAAGCAAPVATPTPSTSPTAAPSAAPSAEPSAAPTAAATLSLKGGVYDDDLQPVAGATVTATGTAGDKTATTDAQGLYALELAPGDYTVKAGKADYAERTQTVSLGAAKSLDFGGQTIDGGNPYFMTKAPEIQRVTVKEAAPGGPLVATFEMSEPLTAESQSNFKSRFQFMTSGTDDFLRPGVAAEPYLANKASWDAAGKVFTFAYDEPYLAGTTYTVRLRQKALADQKDPVTHEQAYENMRITDAAGEAIGLGRADFAFLRPRLDVMAFRDLADKAIGYTPSIRRWNLTHNGDFVYTTATDTKGPGLASVLVKRDEQDEGSARTYDEMELRFTEPMRVVKDKDEDQYTLLKLENQLVVLNVSENADGSNPKSLTTSPTNLEFSRTEPNLVRLRFPSGTFKTYSWVEVTLGPDAKDPAGNKPDPATSRKAGPVG